MKHVIHAIEMAVDVRRALPSTAPATTTTTAAVWPSGIASTMGPVFEAVEFRALAA